MNAQICCDVARHGTHTVITAKPQQSKAVPSSHISAMRSRCRRDSTCASEARHAHTHTLSINIQSACDRQHQRYSSDCDSTQNIQTKVNHSYANETNKKWLKHNKAKHYKRPQDEQQTRKKRLLRLLCCQHLPPSALICVSCILSCAPIHQSHRLIIARSSEGRSCW